MGRLWDRLRRVTLAAAFAASAASCATQVPGQGEIPRAAPKGHLLIAGGGPIPDSILDRFVALAGGAGRASIVLFPMASEDPDAGVELAEHFRSLGARAELLVLSHEQADSEDAARRLEGATGIWFGGGDQSRLTAALHDTRTGRTILARFQEGAVVGGTSAGAAVMSATMLTGDERRPGGDRPPEKDSGDEYMTIARENVVTSEGFDLLPGAIVDQHFVRRRRNNRLLSLVLEHPDRVGVGIDESTALEVGPNGVWRVLGASVVVVFDARWARITPPSAAVLGAEGVRLHVLPAGGTFDPRVGRARLP